MSLCSLILQSNLMFHEIAGRVIERPTYVVVQTPGNSGYHWGNYLMLKETPRPGSAAGLVETFRREFENLPEVRHQAITWPGTSAALPEFDVLGFATDRTHGLAAITLNTLTESTPIDLRRIDTDEWWDEVIQLQLRSAGPQAADPDYEIFLRKKFADYRALAERGAGDWWGAYVDKKLVADLGLYYGPGYARFQNVETHPDYRRRGLCRALVHAVSSRSLRVKPDTPLLIEASPNETPERIYRALGFKQIELIESVCLSPSE